MVEEKKKVGVGKYMEVHKITKATNIIGDELTREEAISLVNFSEYDLYEMTEKMGAVQVCLS